MVTLTSPRSTLYIYDEPNLTLSLDLLRASFSSSSILIQMHTNIHKWIHHFRQHGQGNTSNTPKGSHIGPILRNVPISPEEGEIGGYTAEEACDPGVFFFRVRGWLIGKMIMVGDGVCSF